ncbi:RNA pseudouridine synthase [Moraxella caviae]|uniref:RNA pseudouridine synthase n=1 Tax=Moraxella caviae TaxID=34060 RepID=A0A1T0A1L6_9GAMM|nr:RluA family pseudouridine synthase [Moraxella caviae]OOR89577.1 RNA pseudouridine synthase [Moraxella caviae]STZ10258.1 Ribosomal large subunit pseudouridine synthase A [Moraxella caviae]VEW13239.1 Ribosomal large subunit pseudouridine synthase A [Moraxella caviae]
MNITEADIARLNAEELDKPQAFFEEFAHAITVYADDDIWVVDKPAGLLSVDGKTLKVSLQSRLLRVNPEVKLIHRLDMDTSGLMIFGKSAAAQTHISKQFIERIPQKEYQAVVFGTLGEQGEKGVIDVPVRYESTTKPRHIVDETWSKRALTHYQVLRHELRGDESGEQHAVTRVALKPITGRSHQLRVHMVHLGHVMIGDPIYAEGVARQLAPRLNLHAHKLRLKHPTHGAWMDWVSEVGF